MMAFFFTLFTSPLPQEISYHCFADQDHLLIPHFWNVISNLPFILIGLYGLIKFSRHYESSSQFLINYLLAIGILLTGLGSSYYHWNPNNETLLWDRLPMTILFMSFFSSVLSRYISPKFYKIGIKLFIPAGISSVIYWSISESLGKGDLRFYALVQFLPILLIPLIMWMYRSKKLPTRNMLWIMYLYITAKAFELFDHETFLLLKVISGHSIKHLLAATACYFMIRRELNIIKKKNFITN